MEKSKLFCGIAVSKPGSFNPEPDSGRIPHQYYSTFSSLYWKPLTVNIAVYKTKANRLPFWRAACNEFNNVRTLFSADIEVSGQFDITFEVLFAEVVQQTASAADHCHQTPAGAVIFLVGSQMLGQVFNPLGEQRDLHFRGAGVAFFSGVLLNNCCLFHNIPFWFSCPAAQLSGLTAEPHEPFFNNRTIKLLQFSFFANHPFTKKTKKSAKPTSGTGIFIPGPARFCRWRNVSNELLCQRFYTDFFRL